MAYITGVKEYWWSDSRCEDRHQAQHHRGEEPRPGAGGGGWGTGHVWVLGQQREADSVGPAKASLYVVLPPSPRLAVLLAAVFLIESPGAEPGSVNISEEPLGSLSGQPGAPLGPALKLNSSFLLPLCPAALPVSPAAVRPAGQSALHSPALSPPSLPEEAKH